jgi:ADP-ribose pyrophosphatase YjhB (NUDIX family)
VRGETEEHRFSSVFLHYAPGVAATANENCIRSMSNPNSNYAKMCSYTNSGLADLARLSEGGASTRRFPKSKSPMIRRVPFGLVAAYWRLTRGATLGAQGVVIGDDGQILLVRHGYRPGWHFPGGGIEWGETAEIALARELREEAGVIMKDRAQLFGLFANFAMLPSDHVALYIVREWERPSIPPPNREIAESRFFSQKDLPANITRGTSRRLREIFEGAPVEPHW